MFSKYFPGIISILFSLVIGLTKSVEAQTYSCRPDKAHNIPITFVQTARGEIPLIYWYSEYFSGKGDTPEKRCKDTSKRLQTHREDGSLRFIRTAVLQNGIKAICVTQEKRANCSDVIVTLPPNVDPKIALFKLTNLREIAATAPLHLTNDLLTYDQEDAYISIDKLIELSAPIRS